VGTSFAPRAADSPSCAAVREVGHGHVLRKEDDRRRGKAAGVSARAARRGQHEKSGAGGDPFVFSHRRRESRQRRTVDLLASAAPGDMEWLRRGTREGVRRGRARGGRRCARRSSHLCAGGGKNVLRASVRDVCARCGRARRIHDAPLLPCTQKCATAAECGGCARKNVIWVGKRDRSKSDTFFARLLADDPRAIRRYGVPRPHAAGPFGTFRNAVNTRATSFAVARLSAPRQNDESALRA
jgi:hypothetical protein